MACVRGWHSLRPYCNNRHHQSLRLLLERPLWVGFRPLANGQLPARSRHWRQFMFEPGSAPRDGHAAMDENTIEVTPEILQAGVELMPRFGGLVSDFEVPGDSDLVKRIFLAMLSAHANKTP